MAELQPSIDPYDALKIIYNKDDDTLTRFFSVPCTTPEEHNSLPNQSIFTKDIPLNTTSKTWLRLFRLINHHRLPAAYDDAVEAITWVRNHALDLDGGDHGIRDTADFSNCYLLGFSAGGNIAYHAGVQALSLDLQPLVIKGLILNQSFFSGLQRSQSEVRLATNGVFSLAESEVIWELALPKGCDRDYEYCNPLVNGNYRDRIGLLGRCFVSMRGGDILMDREMEFAETLKVNGVNVVTWFNEEGYHGMDIAAPESREN